MPTSTKIAIAHRMEKFRHRLSFEVERSRAARELLRVERAHRQQLEEERKLAEQKLTQQKETAASTSNTLEDIQNWISLQMGGLIKTVKAVQLEVAPVQIEATPTQRLDEPYLRPALEEIKTKLGDLSNEIFYLKQNTDNTPKNQQQEERSPSRSPPEKPNRGNTGEILAEMSNDIAAMSIVVRELSASFASHNTIIDNIKHTTEVVKSETNVLRERTRDILREIEEVKDIAYSGGPTGPPQMALGAEMAASDTAAQLRDIITPLRDDMARHELKQSLDVNLELSTLRIILECKKSRPRLLNFIDTIVKITTRRNSTVLTIPTDTSRTTRQERIELLKHVKTVNILTIAQRGTRGPGITLRGVARFMDTNSENLGIAFCSDLAKNVTISPGLGALLHGNTKKITMRRKTYNQLPEVNVEGCVGRIVQRDNKTIVLFPTRPHITEFEQACAVLTAIGNRSTPNTPPGKISIDAMTVGYTKGETKDMEGIILASKHHKLVVYEDRGQDLEYLLPRTNPPAIPSTSGEPLANPNISGSEELQLRMEQMERPVNQNSSTNNNTSPIHASLVTLGKALLTTPHKATNNLGRLLRRLTSTPTRTHREITRQKSEPPDTHKGTASIPKLLPATEPRVHSMNALMEFAALTKATLRTHEETCKNILQNYRRGTWGIPTSPAVLRDLLRKAVAAVYDNERGIVFMGTMLGSYMAAYSDTRGFVAARSDGAEEGMYDTAPDDPVVVVAKFTRVMLEGRILAMAESVARGLPRGENPTSWTETTFTSAQRRPRMRQNTSDHFQHKHRQRHGNNNHYRSRGRPTG
ncbi:hypothetical protein ACJJTC_018652 [Scirpophaga incertulas]